VTKKDSRRALLRGLGFCLPLLPGFAWARHRRQAPIHRHKPTHHPAPPLRLLPLVVIDPGHGGDDPGATGRSGLAEKTVTLATALKLHRLLLATGRYRVAMTRHDDRFVALADRAAFGPSRHASLIISLHADSSPNPASRGASVYVRPAGSAMLRRLSRNAPAEIARAVGGAAPGSASLQAAMIDNLDDDLRMTATPARTAHLFVLASHGIPGVLVEMGFISNRAEAEMLRNSRHQTVIARALRDAVDEYFRLQAADAAHRA
jgi:N-acetylmuramoyl-L-alanine amidase